MKFTNGYWQMRAGYEPRYAMQVHEVEIDSNALTVYAATKPLRSRADTPGYPMITIRFSSPMENVIHVQIFHHRGGQQPHPEFVLQNTGSFMPQMTNDEKLATLMSGKLSVEVHKGETWAVKYKAGKQHLTTSHAQGIGYVDTPHGRFIHEQLALDVGECVYGLGERFTAFVKNGQVVDIWNEDGGTSSEQAYKNIPFYLTNRGYGVLVNHPEKVSFEVASEKVERVQFSVPGESLDYFLFYGPTPKEILERYTALTGRPALPPAWSFGLWLSTSFTTDYDEATVTSFIQKMKDYDIPLHVFHFDCFWMKEFHWCDFTWDERCFPDPAGMLQRLKQFGLHICVWINPYIAQQSSLFDEAMDAGYLLKRADGTLWQNDLWQAGMGIVDFTNPAACRWFQSKLRPLLEMGVDTFKTDFGERIPTDVVFADGSDPQRMHNFYAYLYNKTVFDLLREVRGEQDAVVFARSATVGGQQFPVHWGGDSTATFASMAETLRGGLSFGLSGFGFWSHDIGGFQHTSDAAVYKRWAAFGLLSSHSRLHGDSSYRVPWLYDEEAVDVVRTFTKLKCSLMPYLYRAACQAHERGLPVLRAMMLEFPEDPACDYLDGQYMLGDSLLVAPVFQRDGTVSFYIPDGVWTHLLSGATVHGPRWIRETYDFLSLPLFVRPNTVLPVSSRTDRPDYDYSEDVILKIFQLENNKDIRAEIPNLTGAVETTFDIQRENFVLRLKRQGPAKRWQVHLVNVDRIESDFPSEQTEWGTLLRLDSSSDFVEIKLPNS